MKGVGILNWLFWGTLVIIFVYFTAQMLPVKGVKNITTDELKQIIRDKNKQFIDVRTPLEYQTQCIKQFKNIPLQHLRNEAKRLDKDKETVLICRSGSRSMRAARMLKKAGFSELTNVIGGMNHWRG